MRADLDDLRFCTDCTFYVANGPPDEITPEQLSDIEAGMEKLGPHVVPNNDSETGEGIWEFSSLPCDCCGSHLAGFRARHATLVSD